jgi:ComF family protein
MIVRTLLKIKNVCKFFINFILPEDEKFFATSFAKSQSNEFAATCISYKDPKARDLIHSFKYNKNNMALNICSKLISAEILKFSKIQNIKGAIMIPIPRTKVRKQKFGFNQCELLCEQVLKNPNIIKLNLIYEPKILVHNKNFETQTKLSRQTRIQNSKESFSIKNPEKIYGSNILLIDDVWTTGATLTDAERALKESGAKNVFKFAIAH